VCEGWKKVIYFYDRKKHVANQSFDILGRIFMILVNKKLGTWDLRRVAPSIQVNAQYWDARETTEMCPMMQFAARLDPKIIKLWQETEK